MSQKKTYLIDMDGVLVDSEPTHMNSFSQFMDHLDIDYDDSFLNSLIGYSVEHNVEKILTEKNDHTKITLEEGIILREKIYLEMIQSDNLTVEAGIINLIESCNENKIKLNLKIPIVALKGENLGIARNINGHWRLIGWGTIEN